MIMSYTKSSLLTLATTKTRIEEEKITPVLAQLLLNTFDDGKNRSLRSHRVHELAKVMKAGGWIYTGEAITIGADLGIKNGQHTLNAIIASGTTIVRDIKFGIMPEAFKAFDQAGSNRSPGDMFHINYGGIKYAGEIARISMTLWKLINNKLTTIEKNSDRPTNDEKFAICDKYIVADSDRVMKMFNKIKRGRIKNVPSIIAIYIMCYEQDPVLAESFFTQLSGLKADGMAFIAKDYMDNTLPKGTNPERYMAAVIKAWNFARVGETSKRIVLRDKSAFPTIN